MGRSVKFDYRAAIEDSLTAHPEGLPLDDLLSRSGFSVDRTTLFRHLARLIEAGRVERIGNARASRYRRREIAPAHPPLALPDTRDAEPESVPAAAPDYSAAVTKAVRTIVRDWKRFDRINLQIYLSLLVKPEHLSEVAEMAEKELAGLHEGNLDAFGISLAAFRGFKAPASREATGE
jgi:hypothetical protein